ncbi:hypothetical protein MMC26_000600 [Xylographa opegraphella]|nr:hypothetical protein [Xylographa opegraphella]
MFLDRLPPELLQFILSYLDVSPASTTKLYEEPVLTTDSIYQPLKHLSQTCGRYRSLSLPYLFRYSTVQYHDSTLQSSEVGGYLGLLPLRNKVRDFLEFVVKQDLSQRVQSLVISTTHSVEFDSLHLTAAHPARELGDLWTSIFSVLQPHAITISAPPSSLAWLTSCVIDRSDEWAFKMQRHTLQLRTPADISRMNYPKPQRTNKLFQIVPWAHCILNEGSSIQVYNTYQYDAMVQPSILNEFLHTDVALRLLTSLRSFDFVAIFPLQGQLDTLLSFLFVLPNLQRVTIQLAPQKQNRILEDASRVQRSLYSDLWMELETVFFIIAVEVVHKAYGSINELICHDYQQETLWETLRPGGNLISRHWQTIKDGHWKRIDAS